MIWEVSECCNVRCLHCCTRSGPEVSMADDVPTDRMLAIARELRAQEVREVIFSGGEALLRHDFIDIIEVIDTSFTDVYLASNGTVLTRERAARLKKARIRSIDVSLD